MLLSALTHFISFNVRFYLQLVVMHVPMILDENLVAVVPLLQVPKEGRWIGVLGKLWILA